MFFIFVAYCWSYLDFDRECSVDICDSVFNTKIIEHEDRAAAEEIAANWIKEELEIFLDNKILAAMEVISLKQLTDYIKRKTSVKIDLKYAQN